MNGFIENLKKETNFTETENGAVAHKTTLNAVYDMFALGGAYRKRSDEDCIVLFQTYLFQFQYFQHNINHHIYHTQVCL